MSLPDKVTSVNLKKHVPHGAVSQDDFDIVKVPTPNPDSLAPNSLLIKLVYLSVDPYMRGRFVNRMGYLLGPFEVGKPIESAGVGVVLKSTTADIKEGEFVTGLVPWVEIQVVNAKDVTKIPDGGVPLSYYVGAIGMPGMTAFSAIKKIAEPKKGETALVSGAAGAVGQLVVQILKNIYGCKVIAVAGGPEKTKFLTGELKADHVIDYKNDDLDAKFKEYAPNGIDIYWDNVGGETLDLAIKHSAKHARMPICGMISQYNLPAEKQYRLQNVVTLLWNRIRLQGFIVGDLRPEYAESFQKEMPAWIREGKVKVVEDMVKGGLEQAPAAFIGIMNGDNLGKRVVEVNAGIDPYRK
ncbi:NADPH dependent alkenal/alkenone reductase [Phlyctochytrium arcticum]|nr:NADPH dependent alkenal/alkenone reductase [Phlyctochytrium arcticum]